MSEDGGLFAHQVMQACRLPRLPHQVIPGMEGLPKAEQLRLLTSFLVGEGRFKELERAKAEVRANAGWAEE